MGRLDGKVALISGGPHINAIGEFGEVING